MKVKNLSFSYNQKSFIKDLNIEFKENQITTIIGSNGSGKSTLLMLLSRIYKPQEIIDWALEVTHLKEYQNRTLKSLSGGQQQRVWIAMALAQKTPYLLLDEPTTYLDIRYQLELLRLLKEINQKYKITIIMVLHDINQAIQYSDHIIGMKQGQIIVEGKAKAKDIMNQEVIKKIYGIDLQTTIINDQTYVLTV